VTQHQDLDVLRSVGAGEQRQPVQHAERASDRRVQRPQRAIMLARVATVMLRSASGKVLLRDGDGVLGTHTPSPSTSTCFASGAAKCLSPAPSRPSPCLRRGRQAERIRSEARCCRCWLGPAPRNCARLPGQHPGLLPGDAALRAVQLRRSSSAAKKADADFRIAFARRNSRTSRSSSVIRAAASVVVPGRVPASTSACATQPRNVSGLIPSCPPIRGPHLRATARGRDSHSDRHPVKP
jgi:hypothetical protein